MGDELAGRELGRYRVAYALGTARDKITRAMQP